MRSRMASASVGLPNTAICHTGGSADLCGDRH